MGNAVFHSPMNVEVSDILVDVSLVDIQVEDTSTNLCDHVWKGLKERDRQLLIGREQELKDRLISMLHKHAQGM